MVVRNLGTARCTRHIVTLVALLRHRVRDVSDRDAGETFDEKADVM
jgi:hypothetical protein